MKQGLGLARYDGGSGHSSSGNHLEQQGFMILVDDDSFFFIREISCSTELDRTNLG